MLAQKGLTYRAISGALSGFSSLKQGLTVNHTGLKLLVDPQVSAFHLLGLLVLATTPSSNNRGCSIFVYFHLELEVV